LKHNYIIKENNIYIRSISEEDLKLIVSWRNKDSIRKWFVNQNVLNINKQEEWFSKYLIEENNYIFIIEEQKEFKQPIGMASIYNINEEKQEAEFGRLLIGLDEARGKGISKIIVNSICKFAFEKFNLKKVYLEVFKENKIAIRTYKKCGFKYCYEKEVNNKKLIRMEVLLGEKYNLISVIGLGYVGLPLAVNFAERGKQVIAFDINSEKIELYKKGQDTTNEIGHKRLSLTKNIKFTSNPEDLKCSRFHIIAVPTPVDNAKVPNLNAVKSATKIVGQNLIKGSIVVFESTVYPGVTEEICVPILEKESGLIYKKDFKVGYSPERINPGDKVHTVEKIKKVVSGCDKESLDVISKTYSVLTDGGVYHASSIKVAEAAKIIENAQRDINIAFINEVAIIFDKMEIDTKEVLEAASTKWNFLNFNPGLVGGHCIGIDPYYLTYKAQQLNYRPEVILSGRRINDNMGKVIAEKTVEKLIANDQKVKDAKVLIMGITFKEDVPDLRNSKVKDVIDELRKYKLNIIINDPLADKEEVALQYDLEQIDLDKVKDIDAIIICVSHKQYKKINLLDLKKYYNANINKPVLIDIKGIYDKNKAEEMYSYWRL
jgi:UDP-N-acetyl-D-galactosamine dehydrogenase